MRKTHFKVTLDIFVHSDEGVNVGNLLEESGFVIDPNNDLLNGVADIQDITIEDMEITDSR